MISNAAEPQLDVSDSLWSVERIQDYIESRGIAEELDKEVRQAFDEAVAAYIDSPSPPETLYHYTGESEMRSILLSSAESRHLRATEMAHTNDATEPLDAFVSSFGQGCEDRIRDSLDRIAIHLACFSPDAEMPGQWKEYGNWYMGCAIGFNTRRLQEWCLRQNPGLPIFAMNYDRNRHEEMCLFFGRKVKQLYRRMLPPEAYKSPALDSFLAQGRATEFLLMLQFHLKDEQWQGEHEWRIRAMRHRSQHPGSFTELRICTPDLVTELILGSRYDGEPAAVERELREAGFGGVKVRRSSCRL